jgi:TfoX/Sxy family transcriptional regulator of competence genes
MPHVPAELQKHVEAAAPLEIELRFRPMFGGIGVYADGRMFLSLSDVGLALKLGEAERAMLLKIPGAKPLQYEPNSPPSKSYVVVPDRMLADRKALRDWIARSATFAKSTAAKPRPAKRKPAAVRKPRSR